MRNIRFTRTVDVLFIVAIVFVVVLVVMPMFARRGPSSTTSLCLYNLSSLGRAMSAYRDDWDGRSPDASVASVWGHGSRRTWSENLYRYHGKIETYRCPGRDVNFAYAMNDRLSDKAPKSPAECIAIYECPGSGNAAYRINPEKDNWRGWWGREMGWATGNAGLSGSKIRKMPGNTVFDNPSYSPRDISKAKRKPAEICADLVFPGMHGAGNCVLFWDGHVKSIDQWTPWSVTFDPNQAEFPNPPGLNN